MPTYSTPGVYVNEGTLSSLTPSFSGGTAAVFFGEAERGPTTVTAIDNWASYKRVYGDLKDAYDIGYAVYHYFANGGRTCYVVRVAASDAAIADNTSIEYYPNGDTGASSAATLFDADAISAGAWGNSLKINIVNGQQVYSDGKHGTFTVVITDGTTEVERWTEVSLDPNSSRYVGTVINTYSNYIVISNVSTEDATADNTFDTSSTFSLANGSDGSAVADSDYTTAVDLLDPIEGMLLLNAVGNTSGTVITALVNKAAARGDSFVIVDPDKTDETLSSIQTTSSNFTNQSNGGYAAHYAPALKMVDPAKTGPGAIRVTYPGGAVAGLMVRTETQRSVAKAPAGFDADIRGAIGLVANLSNTDIGTLYDGSTPINAFKAVPGGGVVVYGARTLSRTATDKFIPVRRTLNYLKYNLKRITDFAVFQPNDPNLWNRINLTVASFLGEFYRSGGLKGTNAAQAFYVVCNSTNNTATSIDQGIVNVEVGVALQYPAEFIVINLSQWTGGGNAAESL